MKAYDITFKPERWPDVPLPGQQSTPTRTEAARLVYRLAVEGRIAAITTVKGDYVWAKACSDGKLTISCLGEVEREDAIATIERDHGVDVSVVESGRERAKSMMKSRGIR